MKIDGEDIKSKLKEKYSKEPTSNFEYNIFNSLFIKDDTGIHFRQYFTEVSMVCFAIKSVSEPEFTYSTQHIGSIGEKIIFEGIISSINAFETDFGWAKSISFMTDDQVQINWFTTSSSEFWIVGEHYKVSATVKDHKKKRIKDKDHFITSITRAKEMPLFQSEKDTITENPFFDEHLTEWINDPIIIKWAKKTGVIAKHKTFGKKKFSVEVIKGGYPDMVTIEVNKELPGVLENSSFDINDYLLNHAV
jgi:hypothetical protein